MINRLATQVPLPQSVFSYLFSSDYDVSTSVPPLVAAKSIQSYDTILSKKFNVNASLLDINAQYGGGVVGIIHGLILSHVSALTISISPGGALIGGVVQKRTPFTTIVNDNTTNFVWLKQNGMTEITTTISPPVNTTSVFLGTVIAVSGVVTFIDFSGVVYYRGFLFRQTADLSHPLDTPNVNPIFISKTLNGDYLWDGTTYNRLEPVVDLVEAVIANRTETPRHRFNIVTNQGATTQPVITLESAVSGVERTYIVHNSVGIRIVPNTGNTIRSGTAVITATGHLTSTVVGSVLNLRAINSTEWVVTSRLGTWVEVP